MVNCKKCKWCIKSKHGRLYCMGCDDADGLGNDTYIFPLVPFLLNDSVSLCTEYEEDEE